MSSMFFNIFAKIFIKKLTQNTSVVFELKPCDYTHINIYSGLKFVLHYTLESTWGKTCQQLPLGKCTDFIKQVGHIYNIGLPCFNIFTYIAIGKMGRGGVTKKKIFISLST